MTNLEILTELEQIAYGICSKGCEAKHTPIETETIVRLHDLIKKVQKVI